VGAALAAAATSISAIAIGQVFMRFSGLSM
jgi:hypothetical protein